MGISPKGVEFISGPWACTFFADQGAEVIKVEI
ncbi:MAG: hypothetical protein EU532_09095 [Promethearchaeota archaeon]|nr:MAG: hypothetical protein EU532_09095 [Candidatus Lokiarchaeota archaeon]